MDWIEVTIHTTQEGIDPVCAVLDGIGIDQVSVREDRAAVKKTLEGLERYWDLADYDELAGPEGPAVCVYLTPDEDGHARLEAIRAAMAKLNEQDIGLDTGSLLVTEKTLQDEDWNENWKKYFKPIPVGDRLLVQPAWQDVDPEYEDRIPVFLEHSSIFGTGQHESTRLCLELLAGTIQPGDTLLDVGCGTGILSIAALKLGASRAVAVDVDSRARSVVPEHAKQNGIEPDRLPVLIGDAVNDGSVADAIGSEPFDLVAANIVADVILPLTPNVPRWVRPGGHYVVSGIIADRKDEVIRQMEQSGFSIMRTLEERDWVAILARYRAAST